MISALLLLSLLATQVGVGTTGTTDTQAAADVRADNSADVLADIDVVAFPLRQAGRASDGKTQSLEEAVRGALHKAASERAISVVELSNHRRVDDARACKDDACRSALAQRVGAEWWVAALLTEDGDLSLRLVDAVSQIALAETQVLGDTRTLLARVPLSIDSLLERGRPRARVTRARLIEKAQRARSRGETDIAEAAFVAAATQGAFDDEALELLQATARMLEEQGLRERTFAAWDDAAGRLEQDGVAVSEAARRRFEDTLRDHLPARAAFLTERATRERVPDQPAMLREAAAMWQRAAKNADDAARGQSLLQAASLLFRAGDFDLALAQATAAGGADEKARRALVVQCWMRITQAAMAGGDIDPVDETEPPSRTAEKVPPHLRKWIEAALALHQVDTKEGEAPLRKGALLLAALGHVEEARTLLQKLSSNAAKKELLRLQSAKQGKAVAVDAGDVCAVVHKAQAAGRSTSAALLLAEAGRCPQPAEAAPAANTAAPTAGD